MTRLWLLAAIFGLTVSAAPASAIVPLPAPNPPGRAPAGWTYRYVPPVYRTVVDRVWISDRIDWVSEWVWVNGRYQQVYRQIVVPGRYEYRTRQVMVSPGYWQLVRIDDPRPYPRPNPANGGVPTVGVEGYPQSAPTDLSPFSGLSEWPR